MLVNDVPPASEGTLTRHFSSPSYLPDGSAHASDLSCRFCPFPIETYALKLANIPKKKLKTLRSVGPSGLPRAALENF